MWGFVYRDFSPQLPTFLFNDVNGGMDEVLELKIRLVLRVHGAEIQREVLCSHKKVIVDDRGTP